MKKTLFTLSVTLLFAIGTWAQTTFTSGNLRYRISNEAYRQVSLYGYVSQPTGKLEIPDLVRYGNESYSVNSIAENTFANCTAITQVIIPSEVRSIRNGAFSNCTSLQHVIIMSSTPPYLAGTPFNTANLQVYVPEHGKDDYMESESWTSFGELKSSIFSDELLRYQIIDAINPTVTVWSTNVPTLPDSILNVPATATENNTTYTVKEIRARSLSNQDYIKEINLPEGITTIGTSAFYLCSNLRKVTLPNSVTYLGENAFAACESLMEVNIPEGITTIEASTFFFCKSLRTLHMPASLTTIKSKVFETCERLTEISFAGSTPPTLEANAFWGSDTKFITIHVPYGTVTTYKNATGWNQVTNIKPYNIMPIIVDKVKYLLAYDEAELIAYLQEPTGALVMPSTITHNSRTYSVTKIAESAFYRNYDITEVTIPNTVTHIGDKAFQLCNQLTTVNIGNELASMGEMPFHNCDKLEQFNVDNQNLYYTSPNGELIDAYSGALLKYPDAKTDTTYTLPYDVIYIEKYAFMDNDSLRHITIYNSTVTAHEEGFSGIADQVTVHITGAALPTYQTMEPWKNLNLQTIKTTHNGLIYEITDMMNRTAKLVGYETKPTGIMDIPDTISYEGTNFSVTAMKSNLFDYRNEGITQINIPATLTSIDNNNFGESPANLACIQVDPANTAYCSEEGVLFTKDKTILLKYPRKKTETTYNIPESVTTIAKNAFESCYLLTEINIPESVTTIGEYAFEGCNSLTQIRIPNGVTTIEDSAFRGCFDLTEINIPNSVTLIESYAFHNCRAATKLTLGENLAEISTGAFYSCYALEEIKILATTPPTVRVNAFENVSRSIPVYVQATALSDYQNSTHWNEFTNLQALQTEFTIDNLRYRITDLANKGVELSGYTTKPSGVLDIPATVTFEETEYTVASIKGNAFSSCPNITQVNIPDGVTSIGHYAFRQCTALTTVNIGSGLTSIGELAFDECSSLTQINVDEANTAFCSENGILFNKDKTTLICYPAAKTETEYTVPTTVTTIGTNAFSDCAAITKLILPASVTTIQKYAFWKCTGLTQMTVLATVPPTVENANAFNNVSRSIPVYVPAEALAAYQAASLWNEFTNLQALQTDFTVGNLIYRITDLINRKVELINHTETQPTGVLDIPATVTYEETEYTVTSIGADALDCCANITQVNIPDCITSIGATAFQLCTYITTINIGSGVTNIGNLAFDECSSLTQINVDEANTAFCSENGVLFSKDKTTLIRYPIGSTETAYAIPSSVTVIGNDAFANAENIEQVIIPENVTSIGNIAFLWCEALTQMTVLATTPPTTGDDTFFAVNADIPVYVPAEALTAYQAANVWKEFTNLQALQTDFTVGNLIYRITDLINRKVELINHTETQPTGVLDIPATVTYEETEYTVTSIGADALDCCANITQVNIPDGITSIEANAFQQCTALTTINIGNGVTSIGDYAFWKCTALTTVTIGSGLTTIGSLVFEECTALTQINVDENNTAFCSENGILFNKEKTTLICYPASRTETAYTVPASVTIIGENAFAYCTALTQIILPESLTDIEDYAFWDCTALTQMTVLATVPPTVAASSTFEDVSRSIPVYVPAEALTDYQAADVWKEFTNFQAIAASNLQTAVMPESISMEGGMLHNPQQLQLTLYDMQGRKVYSGNDATLSLTAGVYIMHCNGASCKVLF